MPEQRLRLALDRLCSSVAPSRESVSDARLLERFVDANDELAFELLVRRHAPMVLHVCRRVVRDVHLAEDAFQATFLVLVRKARSVAALHSVGGWLHRVAYHAALKLRARVARGDASPSFVSLMALEADERSLQDIVWRDLRAVLDEELDRLPEKYRTPIILCYLSGKSYEQAAGAIGCPVGTVSIRLTRARELLRKRLTRRGVALTGGLLATLLIESASAAVSRPLTYLTVRAGMAWATNTPTAGVVSEQVAALAHGSLRSMMISKLKAFVVVVLAIGLIGAAASGLYSQVTRTDQRSVAEVKDSANGSGSSEVLVAQKDLYGDALPLGAVQRLGTARFRHDSTAIAYSPDGKILASGGRDNAIRLFDAASGKEIRRLIGHAPRSYSPPTDAKNPLDALVSATGEGGVNSVAFSPDGKLLASGGWDDTVRIWDVETGKQLRKIDAHKAMVGRVLFSPDGKVLVSRGALDGTVRVWDPSTGTQLQKFVGMSNINPWRFNHDMALAISPDSKTIATTARNSLVFFDIATGGELKRLPSNVYGITAAYSPDGKLLATGGVDPGDDQNSLRIWDVASGKELRKCELPKNEPPTYITWDPNNNGQFAAVIAEDFMHTFDANTGKAVSTLKHYWPSRVIYSPDGKTISSAGSGPTIRHWDPASGKELQLDYEGHLAGVNAVAVTQNGKLIASGAADGLQIWDASTGKVKSKIDVKGGVSCLAFSPDGKTIATGGSARTVQLWDVESGKPGDEFKDHVNRVCGLVFSHDGKLLATGDAQAIIRIFQLKDGKKIREIDNKSLTESLTLAFGDDNKTILCSGAWNDSSFLPKKGQKLNINGKEIELNDDFILDLQGVKMSRKEGNYVMQWEVESGKEVRKFGGLKDTLRSLAYSPDGKLVAAASKDGKICVWDAATGKERLYIVAHPGHTDATFSSSPHLAFSPDSKTLASASTDHTIRLWDVSNAKEIGQFRAPDSSFTSLVFTKDGKHLISGSADTGVLIWDVSLAPKLPPPDKSNVIGIQ